MRRRDDDSAIRLAAIVESSADAIIGNDLSGAITSWNQAAERMFGYPAADMIGRSLRRIIPADRQSEEDAVLAHIGRGQRVEQFETIRQRRNGTLVSVSLTVSPIYGADGQVTGASTIARDISDRVRAEEERAQLLSLAEEQRASAERLNYIGKLVSATQDRREILQAIADAATDMTHAAYGAFFYRVPARGASAPELLSAQSTSGHFGGAAQASEASDAEDAFVFDGHVLRSDDITDDSRSASLLTGGMPFSSRVVRSYLFVPVRAPGGEVRGGLYCGHPDVAVFTAHHQQVVESLASWAAIALENARLYGDAQEASQLKDEFLATLSHELRTPLNAILGYARMIRSGLLAGAKRDRAVETIERNATSLTQIIEDVLDISRIVSGKIRLRVQVVDLSRVVLDAIDTVRPAADAKNIEIAVTLADGESQVWGDPDRLQQIFWNLMSNAVKFTTIGGRVEVGLTRDQHRVEVTVHDSGVGITPEFLPHVFERFRQADASTTRERGGLGLGLAITRQLIEMHGGTVDATSAGRGQGATFRIEMPLFSRARDGAGATHAAAVSADRPPAIGTPDLRGVHVLAVDDDHDALQMVREILEIAGARVSLAASAADAWRAASVEPPDVLLADLGMPLMNGFELLAQIRRSPDPTVRSIPAAALTAYARSEDRTRSLQSGFQLHLAKPIDPGDLLAAIASLVRGSLDEH